MPQAEDPCSQRLDQFLFFARFCKTRLAAGMLIAAGSVRINRQPTEKPHARIRPGDILTLPLPRGVVVLQIRALAKRRGPAPEAMRLYQIME